MELETKLINKVLNYRWYPTQDWKPYTAQELTALLIAENINYLK
jgi:hypothetical protein